MNIFDKLLACVGNWSGTSTLQDPNTGKPEESSSTATVIPVLGGRFVRIDYTWSYQGNPQEGSLLIGYEAELKVATAYWIDSWHMGNSVMTCPGVADRDDSLSMLGSYGPPEGPWGWRITLTPEEGQRLGVVMFNIEPNGKEWLAVEAHYTRV
jgi:hypothetical protein